MNSRAIRHEPDITKAAGPGLIAGVFLLGMASVAMSQTPALLQKSTEAAEIATLSQRDGFVRVIVRFVSPVPASTIKPDPASVANVRAQVAAAQDAVIAAHFGSATNPRAGQGFNRELVRFAITPGFAVSVSRAELDALAADPRVQYINYNRMVPPTLDQSVPLIGMPNAYAMGATGAGQAVVVLDTGVKSNHEFLTGKVIAEACFSNNNVAGGNTLCPNGQGSQIGAGAANPDIANCTIGSTNICDHGTHVSGIAAGFNTNRQFGEPANGVAKNGNIWAI
jgi:subtilisin family serine protease